MKVCLSQLLSLVQPFAVSWTVVCQAPLSMGFPRQEYWSGVPFRTPGDLPDPGIEPPSLGSPALAGGFFTTSATWEALMKLWKIVINISSSTPLSHPILETTVPQDKVWIPYHGIKGFIQTEFSLSCIIAVYQWFPNLFDTPTDLICGRQFFLGPWREGSFRMIQAHYIYCVLYFYCCYIMVYYEIIIQLTIMQNIVR